MTQEERCALGIQVMQAEKDKNAELLLELTFSVVNEITRLEKAGEADEAHAFERFIPTDGAQAAFLESMVGADELQSVLEMYSKHQKEERRCYFVEHDYPVPTELLS